VWLCKLHAELFVLEAMRICVIVLVFVLHFCVCCVATSPEVIVALQRHFYTECVYLLHTDDSGK